MALVWLARSLALVAILISCYLLWVALASDGHVAGCGSDSALDCDHVLSSRWSHVIGMPVSLLAVVLYTLVLMALFAIDPDGSEQNQVYAWRLLLALTLVAGLGGLWFIGLQVFVLQSFCPYCLAVHACGLLLLCFTWAWGPVRLRKQSATNPIDPLFVEPATVGALLAVSLLCVMSLASAQALVSFEERPMDVVEVDAPSAPKAADDSTSASDSPTYESPERTALTSHAADDEPAEPSTAVDERTVDTPTVEAPTVDEAADKRIVDDPPVDDPPTATAQVDDASVDDAKPADDELARPDRVAETDHTDAPPKRKQRTFDPELEALLRDPPVKSKSTRPVEIPQDDAFDTAHDLPATNKRVDDPLEDPGEKPAEEPSPWRPARHRRVSMLGGKLQVDAGKEPVIGNMDADCLVVEMFDYTCPHCRVLHRYMKQAHKRYGDQLAVALVCVPMNTNCNKYVRSTVAMHVNACTYARLALAVWTKAPEQFAGFHDFLMDPTNIPSTRDARREAARILGEDALDEALSDPRLDDHVTANTELYNQAGAGVIPKVIYDRLEAKGEPASAQKLFEVFEQNIGLRPQ